jgi:DNA-binding beta-propeller fold protein YncE
MKALASVGIAALLAGAAPALAQQAPAGATPEEQPFAAGKPLGVTVEDAFTPMSNNVKVYGALVNAESCSYDETRGLIVAVNRGANQDQVPNDGFISLMNPDGSVHTSKWIGVDRNGLVLNHPFGSDIQDGKLYVADRDGGLAEGEETVSVIRMFDMETGAPAGEIKNEESTGFNDIEVAPGGTIYATQTGSGDENPDKTTWRVFEVLPDGAARVLIEGDPLNRPNGIAIDNDGNLVVVNIGNDAVLTFSPEGELLGTENAAQPGNDGIVILPDGTKYVSSVRQGGVSRIRPGEPAELIATGIPSAASMCYDSGANQLVIPMNPNNSLAFVPLD